MLQLKQVERSYKAGLAQTFVLRHINLTIREGDFIAIMGPSDAGKFSLLHVLAMLDDEWRGEFFFDGEPVHTLRRKQRAELARRRIGMVFQSYRLLDELTVAENIDLPLSYKNIFRSERQAMVADTLDRFQIVGKKDLYPSQLSGGQQQLVGIARAVVHSPRCCSPTSPRATSTLLKQRTSCSCSDRLTMQAQRLCRSRTLKQTLLSASESLSYAMAGSPPIKHSRPPSTPLRTRATMPPCALSLRRPCAHQSRSSTTSRTIRSISS